MSYHPELAPRRRPWLIATPLIVVLLLAVGWSGFWYYAASQADARIADWQAQQAGAGRAFSCGKQAVGGYPFRIEARCTDVSVELKDTQPPLALKLKEILVVSQIWDPKLFIAEFTGPLTAADPGQPPHTPRPGRWRRRACAARPTSPTAPRSWSMA